MKKRIKTCAAMAAVVVILAGSSRAATLAPPVGPSGPMLDSRPAVDQGQLGLHKMLSAELAAMVAFVKPSVVKVSVGEGNGTGFIVDSSGFVVTNAHVVERMRIGEELAVETNAPRRRLRAVLVAVQPLRDLALVLIDSPKRDWPVVNLSKRVPAEGEFVVAMGYPLGLPLTVTRGIVSGLDRYSPRAKQPVRMPDRKGIAVTYLQTDASINPGNSGGPLFDMDGKVAGSSDAEYRAFEAATLYWAWARPVEDVSGAVARELDARLDDFRRGFLRDYVEIHYAPTAVQRLSTIRRRLGRLEELLAALPSGADLETLERRRRKYIEEDALILKDLDLQGRGL